MNDLPINLNVEKIGQKHIAPYIQADTLFTFTKKIEYMSEWLSRQMLFSRYNVENIQYLRIKNINKIAFPMKCFCDINLHRLKKHVNNYGCNGLAFSKEWGMKNGVQAVQYINPSSALAQDISTILNPIFHSSPNDAESEELWNLKNYALHQLMFFKPYSDDEMCFTDECEWRYVPSVPDDLQQLILNEQDMRADRLNLFNEIIKQKIELALPFKLEDIKYIIIADEVDFDVIVKTIEALKLNSTERDRLLAKMLIWDTSKEDF